MGGYPPIFLVDRDVCHETVTKLENLLEQARAGELIGIAAVTIDRTHRHNKALTGATKLAPIFTIGALSLLQQELGRTVPDPDP